MSIRNPFRVGTEIRELEDFVGRKDIIQVIFEAMPNLQNISLRGERRTGKTSLLLYLASLTSSDAGLPLTHIPVYFNFQRFAKAKAIRVWQAITDAVSDNVRKRLPDGQAESERLLSSFNNLPEEPELYVTVLVRYLVRLGSSGFNILFLFDEFEKTKDNSYLGESFYDTLRSLPTETGNISYIIAARTGLAELHSSYDKISSPFFNMFTRLTLGPFSGNEVQYLIFKYCERAEIDFSLAEKLADESSFLYDKTGYHPYFLQSLCYHLFMKSDMPDWPLGQAQEEALRAFEKDLEPHFEYYWEVSSLKEQELIKKLATSQEISWNELETKALAKILKDRCLVVQTSDSEGLWRLSSSFFGEWVENNVTRQELLTDNSISDSSEAFPEEETAGSIESECEPMGHPAIQRC